MGKKMLPEVDKFPVLIKEKENKTCYLLGKDGYLRQFPARNEEWEPSARHPGWKQFRGFDAVAGYPGKHLLVAYSEEGTLFLLQPEELKVAPEPFYREKNGEIVHLSACPDGHDGLHVLHLSLNRGNETYRLVYHRRREGKWEEPVLLDSGQGAEQFAFITAGPGDLLFILRSGWGKEPGRPILRELKKDMQGTTGESFPFPEGLAYPLLPSFSTGAGNMLHISWISFSKGKAFLHYICRASGEWENMFSQEISPFSFPLPLLFVREREVLLAWKDYNTISHLYSADGGVSWQKQQSQPLGQHPQPVRLRSRPFSESQGHSSGWQGEYLFAYGTPPHHLVQPEQLIQYGRETEPFEEEFQYLGHLYSSLAARTGQMHHNNINLQKKLTQKEQEYSRLYSQSILKSGELEEKIKSQQLELQRLEATVKSTLKELQGLIKKEKEALEERLLQQSLEIRRLQEENKNLREEKVLRQQTIKELQKKNLLLQEEKEELQKKRGHFLQRLFRSYRP